MRFSALSVKAAAVLSVFISSAVTAPSFDIEARQGTLTPGEILVEINAYSLSIQHVTALALQLSYVDTDDESTAENVVDAYLSLYTRGEGESGNFPNSISEAAQYAICDAVHTTILASNLFDDTLIAHTSSFTPSQRNQLVQGLNEEKSFALMERDAFSAFITKDTCFDSFLADKDSADKYYDAAISALQSSE